jgi:class 3 adenylate cyclase
MPRRAKTVAPTRQRGDRWIDIGLGAVLARPQSFRAAPLPRLPRGRGSLIYRDPDVPDHAHIGIRRALVQRHPWLPVNTYLAEAEDICYRQLETIGHSFTTLPWPVHEFAPARALMGEDFCIAAWRSDGCEVGFGVGIAQVTPHWGRSGSPTAPATLLPSTCNLAARLCAEAKRRWILISSRVARAVGAVARLEDLGELELRGLRRPVAAFNAVQSADARRSSRFHCRAGRRFDPVQTLRSQGEGNRDKGTHHLRG